MPACPKAGTEICPHFLGGCKKDCTILAKSCSRHGAHLVKKTWGNVEERAENRAHWQHAAECPMLRPEPKRLNEQAPLKKQALSKQADQNKNSVSWGLLSSAPSFDFILFPSLVH